MTIAAALLLLGGLALPHVVDARAANPVVAIVIWGAALVLRALTMLLVVAALVITLPQTDLFSAVTHWCWHTVLPVLTTHLGLDGHRVGDAAIVIPAAVLAASLAWVAVGVTRATRSVSRMLRRAVVGTGPDDSLILEGAEVILAAAGIARPRVVVSAGALMTLDDEELAAGLAHERGHIEHRHRFILLGAELCRGLARFLPGTRQAMRELVFHLERDADQWAIARRHDPLALASAICKAATSRATSGLAFASLGGGTGVSARLRELTGETSRRPDAGSRRRLRFVAVAMACLTLSVAAVVPVAVADAASTGPTAPRHCED